MSELLASYIYSLIGVALLAANLPWLSERRLLVLSSPNGKRIWWRWLEWLILYFVVGGIAFGMERKLNGEIFPQGWEFYAVTACLFLVLALPGFLWRYEWRRA